MHAVKSKCLVSLKIGNILLGYLMYVYNTTYFLGTLSIMGTIKLGLTPEHQQQKEA